MRSSAGFAVVMVAVVLVVGACGDDGDSLVDTPPAATFDSSSWVVESGTFDDAARKRLTEIVSRCPVHRTLEGGPKMFETVEFLD